MLKQALIAGVAVAFAAVPAFAWGGNFHSFNTKTVTVTKAHVYNNANVTNTTVTVANTGLNFTGSNGGTNNANTTSGKAEDGGHYGGITGGAQYQGGAASNVTTGDAGAASVVTNAVNTTSVSF